jgi:hypothetical protein
MKKEKEILTTENTEFTRSSQRKTRCSLCLFLCVLCGLSSCDKGEIPIPPREPGNVLTAQVQMGSDYREVIYYNLVSNSIVKQHLKTDWDLGFETGADGWHVILNSAKAMSASLSYERWLKNINNDNDAEWMNDVPSGNLDSTAIGDWKNDPQVFLIDRGYGISGNAIGIMKIRVEEMETGYRLHFADIASSDSSALDITKDDAVNFVCASLEGTGSIADIEPNKQDWHIKFTQYTHVFVEEGEVIPYTVTGALLNPYQMHGLLQTEVPFDGVDLDLASSFMYSSAINVIGYDWKYYDFELASYTVHPEMVYLLRNSDGIYWKLHFIDFYTQSGEKGAPMFGFQEL